MHARKPIPFLIVADLRTGSTLLSSTLSRHPDIQCLGELLHHRDFADNQLQGVQRHDLTAQQLIAGALEGTNARAAGFRAMLFHPDPTVRPLWADAWDVLRNWPGLRVIHLYRKDQLAQYASLRIAMEIGCFTPSPDDPVLKPENRPRLHIQPGELEQWIAERRLLTAKLCRQLEWKPWFELSYEALVTDWDRQMNRIQRFIGVEACSLPQAKQKQEQRPLSEFILNLGQLRASVGTGL